MGNCFSFKASDTLPIETKFKLPSPLPAWPPASGGFGSGVINLGAGLEVCQVSSFTKIWAAGAGGQENLGATFFEPILPQGFSLLSFYCQPNNKSLSGWVLAGKDNNSSGAEAGEVLQKPLDYSFVWSSESSKIRKPDGNGYIWLPIPPEGYRAVGHVITTSPEKPSVEKIRCVRSDLTEQLEKETLIWGDDEFQVYSCRPVNRGLTATGVSVGGFLALPAANSPAPLFCLKNTSSITSPMPDLSQITTLFKAYSPMIYFHSKEKYLPSSVDWFFSNGALLYSKSNESNPVPINPDGSNLPQNGPNDGLFWLDLPGEDEARERLKHGDLHTMKVYLHVKPMLGGTFTDIAIWMFFPFNGPATAKVGLTDVPFRQIGQHVGDWEHVTLRISNFSGELWRVYFAQHSKGIWVDPPELEFGDGNKVAVYSSLNGHAAFPAAGLVLQGSEVVGIKNETEKSSKIMDAGEKFVVVSGEYLSPEVAEPAWLNYNRKWGPRIEYPVTEEIEKLENLLPEKLRERFREFVNRLPEEIRGEEGPTGPKMKDSWNGDEP